MVHAVLTHILAQIEQVSGTGGGRGGGRKAAAAPRTFQLPEAADGWATISVSAKPRPLRLSDCGPPPDCVM